MSIKIIILKSGEEMISDISEMAVSADEVSPTASEDDQRVVGYFLRRPCLIRKKNPGVINKQDKLVTSAFEVTLIPWIALAADDVVPIPADWLVTMVEPVNKLKDMYVEDVLSYGQHNQSNTANEQSDSGE